MTESVAVLAGTGLRKSYGRGRKRAEVLHGVDIGVHAGECLAIIGESGSGKTTASRILFGLDDADGGDVAFEGRSLAGKEGRAALGRLRDASGIVTQNPFDSLDPRWTAGQSVAEPLRLRERSLESGQVAARVAQALELMALPPADFFGRYPCDMSGGQAQRVAIARAIVTSPALLLADEPMSAVDVAARIQILEAFEAIREARPETAIVMVSHDLGVVQHIADTIIVMQDGCVVERGTAAQVLADPREPYTKTLVRAATL